MNNRAIHIINYLVKVSKHVQFEVNPNCTSAFLDYRHFLSFVTSISLVSSVISSSVASIALAPSVQPALENVS